MRRCLTLVCALLALGAAPAAAEWRELPGAFGPLGTDGTRWAVAGNGRGNVMVFDDRSPAWRELATDPACLFEGVVGPGRAVLTCGRENRWTYELLDLLTASVSAIPGQTYDYGPLMGGSSIEAVAVGRRWLELEISGYHAYGLRSYGSLTDASGRSVHGPRVEADLDATDVRQPLCDPVRRPETREDEGSLHPAYERMHRTGRWWVTKVDASFSSSVRAWRCGAERPRVIFKAALGFQAGAGIVTAVDEASTQALAYRLADGRSIRVALPADDGYARVLHTRRHLFLTRGVEPFTVSVAPLRF